MTASDHRSYPQGVPCWIQLDPADLDATTTFYGGLFGWEFRDIMPPDAPTRYIVASLDGRDAAAFATGDGSGGWFSYIAVDDADASASTVEGAGGTVVEPPPPPGGGGPFGRGVVVRDPQGAGFRLWQAGSMAGAQVVNENGAWNFSDLHTPDVDAAMAFYGDVFGWARSDDLGAGMVRLAGYGDHLEATIDPDIRQRQEFAPEGFADVIAGITADPTTPAQWWIRFSVDDRDATLARLQELGGTELSRTETDWTREAVVADPEGHRFVVSELVMPD